MRPFGPSKYMEKFRIRHGQYGSFTGEPYGAFNAVTMQTLIRPLMVILASSEDGWEHVSVSHRNRTPDWKVMCWVKDQFWDPEVTVMQLHPPRSAWVNNMRWCLHLWRPTNMDIPCPPDWMVGIKQMGELK